MKNFLLIGNMLQLLWDCSLSLFWFTSYMMHVNSKWYSALKFLNKIFGHVFHRHTELPIILASEALLRENEKSSNKISVQWALSLGPQSFRYNTLLSELPRNGALGISFDCFFSVPLQLEPIEGDHINILAPQSNSYLNSSERRASDLNLDLSDNLTEIRQIFLSWKSRLKISLAPRWENKKHTLSICCFYNIE